MRNLFTTFFCLVLAIGSFRAYGQLVVTTGQTAQQLAELIAGPGVVVSNASITGSPDAIGAFTTGANATGLNVSSGVVFGTGEVMDFAQNQTTFSSSVLGTPGNPYLAGLAGITSNDALTLEFDFVPNADLVSFDYVFGSEEHPSFSCNPTFNDIFAITVQGVTVPFPETLITLVPGTATPVSIGTVNNQGCGNPNYYVDNTVQNSLYVVFGGFTTVITAETPVICGETYHLRMMISDGGDSSYDTGCFVVENSLTTGSVVIETATAAADSTAYEGCNDATVTLTLNGPTLGQNFQVPIWIESSTAEYGVDYEPIPELNQADSTITIPAGQNTVSFTITPINDNTAEGPEYIEFTVITSTCGLTNTFRIYINDLDPITTTTSNDTTICIGNATAWCQASGGGGTYTYTWDNGFGVAQTISPAPTITTTYQVSVEDNCGSAPAIDSVTVTVDDGPTPFAGNDVSVCIGGSVLLNATSNAPGSTFAWSPATDLSNPNVYNPLCTPQQQMEYIVTVTRSDGCSNDDTVLVSITPPPTGTFDLPTVGCAGEPLLVEYSGNASPAAQYLWDFGGGVVTNGNGGGPLAVLWDTPGIYNVSLTVSWNGCISPTETGQIEILGPPMVSAGADVEFCSGESVAIGSAPLAGITYSWSPINGVADPLASSTTLQLVNPTHSIQIIEYVLTAIDQGCKNYDTVEVTVFPTPTAEFAIPDGLCFTVNSFDLLATGYFGPNATFDWDFGPVGYPAGSTLQDPQGVIFNAPGLQDVTLIVTDNGCESNPFIGTIEVYEMPDADFTFNVADGCEPLRVNFQDQSYNGGSSLYYSWNLGNGASSTNADPTAVYDVGVYSVSLNVQTSHGCADAVTRSNIIEAYLKPDALFSANPKVMSIIDPNVTVVNLADSVVSSEFTFYPMGDEVVAFETQYELPDTGTFSITQIVTTANGCMDTISGKVEVKPHFTLYIPNAFTPDDNDLNETWIPQGQSIKSFEMTIYNRWNQELFFSASLDEGWDGTFMGKPVPQGVYVYHVRVIDILGEPHIYRGRFSLIR
ncbi:MAG: choice-of-anchor L domain-containing protein [Flavobacteriales bacterium]|nr:choice-of-anchor L domain-containing protein [Flavobacteriales bacterium]